MTDASQSLRDAGYTAEQLHRERTGIVRHLHPDAQGEWHTMVSAVMDGRAPAFRYDESRHAMRRYGTLYASPLSSCATCDACGEGPDDCRCAHDWRGRLYVYACPVCDSPCESGEPCCEEERDDEDDDGYSRHDWPGIQRRTLEPQGEKAPWAPYYVGIELETDSTPGDHSWRLLRTSPVILGAWSDGSVRGPEIVTQPVRGEPLRAAVGLLAGLDVSLTSESDREGQQCGMHIHVDARELTGPGRRAVVRLWMAVREAFWEHPDLHLREDCSYCDRLSDEDAGHWLTHAPDDGDAPSAPSRYRDLNLRSLQEHSTIEVRLWGWPRYANGWPAKRRAQFIAQCVQWTQAVRLAARYVGESGLEARHPAMLLAPGELLACLESLVPLMPEVI